MLTSLGLAFFFQYCGRNAVKVLHRRESILLVALIWLLAAGVGALPFLLTDAISSPLDAYFEAMSGFTTTGSSVLEAKLGDLGKAILFWRSFMQWLGGMGIVVLFIAVLPALSMGGRFLF